MKKLNLLCNVLPLRAPKPLIPLTLVCHKPRKNRFCFVMPAYELIVKDVERLISLAEIAWKSGNTRQAIIWAKAALREDVCAARAVALRIFIARALAKLGKIKESNTIYRGLLNEKNYIPPVVMGLLYNNFHNSQKAGGNIKLVKLFAGGV